MSSDRPTEPPKLRPDLLARLDALAGEVTRIGEELAALRALVAERAATVAPAQEEPAQAAALGLEPLPRLAEAEARTPEEVLTQLFHAASMEDGDEAFASFLAMMHPLALEGPRAESSLRYFQWKQLRKNVREYLTDPGRPDSFTITERRPARPAPNDMICKVFVASSRRMAVPVALRRVGESASDWRVEICSL